MFLLTYYIFPYQNSIWLSEDNLIEYTQFFLYLFAFIFAITDIYNTQINKEKTSRAIWIRYLWVFLLFFLAMEEIDWGSRIIQYRFPTLQDINSYRAVNLHNIVTYQDPRIVYFVFFLIFGLILPLLEKKLIPKFSANYYPTFLDQDYIITMSLGLGLTILIHFTQIRPFYEFSELCIAASFFYLEGKRLNLKNKKNEKNEFWLIVILLVICFSLGFSYFKMGITTSYRGFNPDHLITRSLLKPNNWKRSISINRELITENKVNPYFWGYLPANNASRFFLLSHLYNLGKKESSSELFLSHSKKAAQKAIAQNKFLLWMIENRQKQPGMLTDKEQREIINDHLALKDFFKLNYHAVMQGILTGKLPYPRTIEFELTDIYRLLLNK